VRALVIGGSTGIGAATVEVARAVGFDTREMSRTSGVDVRRPERFRRALLETPTPDLLVYCAGEAAPPRPLLDEYDSTRHRAMSAHYHGAAIALTWWARRWLPRHGNPAAVVVASTAGTRPSPEWNAYAASKAAAINLGLTASAEWAPLGLRVYTVAPGRCATALRATLAPEEDPATIMQPLEVANILVSLHNDEPGLLAGQVLEVRR
jgi:3-oxoacyl-[acyl-carrier protein] reductase